MTFKMITVTLSAIVLATAVSAKGHDQSTDRGATAQTTAETARCLVSGLVGGNGGNPNC